MEVDLKKVTHASDRMLSRKSSQSLNNFKFSQLIFHPRIIVKVKNFFNFLSNHNLIILGMNK